MTRLAVIDPRWLVSDPTTEAYFFLAQELVQDSRITEAGLESVATACSKSDTVIIDNVAYEGEMLDAEVLAQMAEQIQGNIHGRYKLPYFVAPDWPMEDFAETLDAYWKFRERLDDEIPVMLVPHAKPNDPGALATALRIAVKAQPRAIGLSILSWPAAAGPLAQSYHRPFKYGPEFLRFVMMQHVCVRNLLEVGRANGTRFHMLGWGWDWWSIRGNPCLDLIDSIDTHKPATYAKYGMLMQKGLVVDKQLYGKGGDMDPSNILFWRNVERLKEALRLR